LLSLVWTQFQTGTGTGTGIGTGTGTEKRPVPPVIPLDFRVYDVNADQNGQHFTKNDHFRALVSAAKARGLKPQYVAFDSWYAGLENLKHLRREGFWFLTRLKSNRQVNPDKSGLVEVSTLCVPEEGMVVQLRGFGLVRLFQKRDAKGQVEHWATSDTAMTLPSFRALAKACWGIESYHRGLKGCCGVERAQVRSATGQKNHLLLALRAFLRLEAHRINTGLSWYEAKIAPFRNAIQSARTHTKWSLIPSA